MSGSQIRYNVFAGEQLVACISFCACAWKLKDRERFIGWSERQRQKNLQLVINNARFLVLPWIECKGLASKILSLASEHKYQRMHIKMMSIGKRIPLVASIAFQAFSVTPLSIDQRAA